MDKLQHILFIDIETVPLKEQYEDLTEGLQREWDRKSRFLMKGDDEDKTSEELFFDKAGVFAEFAKVVCISFGSMSYQKGEWNIRLKSIANDDEKELLAEFKNMLNRFSERYPGLAFCGHNIKEFDVPFLCRRMIVNGESLPAVMQLSGKKPWENPHIDTLELWKFGDYKNFTSLALLAEIFGIPSPKEDIDGSMVGAVYWKDKDLERISKYCLRDVLTTARVFLKLKGMGEIDPHPIFVDE